MDEKKRDKERRDREEKTQNRVDMTMTPSTVDRTTWPGSSSGWRLVGSGCRKMSFELICILDIISSPISVLFFIHKVLILNSFYLTFIMFFTILIHPC